MGFSTSQLELLVLLASFLGLGYAGVQTALVLREDPGDEKMAEISGAIREGAIAFLKREYTVVAVVAAVLTIVIAVAFGITGQGAQLAVGFAAGVGGSALAGAVGMLVSVRANVRTAAKARGGNLGATMSYAFRGGSVTGLSVAGLALLELIVFYWGFNGNVLDMVGLLFGASLMSLFARVGGGIYTKGADVGTDLVGKVEAGIPEDDPRNPGVIADNVGDNVGDCAGMAADLFETYVVTAMAAMLLAYLISQVPGATAILTLFPNAVLFPLLVCAWAIVATIIGTFFVRMGAKGTIMGALYQGLAATTAVGILGLYLLDYYFMNGNLGIFVATAIGLIVMILIVVITDYYTSAKYWSGPQDRGGGAGRRGSHRHQWALRGSGIRLDAGPRDRRGDTRSVRCGRLLPGNLPSGPVHRALRDLPRRGQHALGHGHDHLDRRVRPDHRQRRGHR